MEDKVARKPDAADFKQLKILLRMLEDRIAQAVPNVRGCRSRADAEWELTCAPHRRAEAPRIARSSCLTCYTPSISPTTR